MENTNIFSRKGRKPKDALVDNQEVFFIIVTDAAVQMTPRLLKWQTGSRVRGVPVLPVHLSFFIRI